MTGIYGMLLFIIGAACIGYGAQSWFIGVGVFICMAALGGALNESLKKEIAKATEAIKSGRDS